MILKRISTVVATAAAGTVLLAGTSFGAVTFDEAAGTGFVGKGDVQTVLGLNNKQVQDATLNFTYDAVTEQETSWTCINERNENVQERNRTTTSTTTGVVSAIARVKNQITGYNLNGFTEGSQSTEVETDGPPLNSCPNANSSYVLGSTNVGESETISGGLFVNGVALP